jgi:nitrile hydratase alpha subunit
MAEQHVPHTDGADHDHGHDHPGMQADGRPPYYAQRIRAIEALLTEKGILSHEDIQHQIDYIESRSPGLGARMVARAWVDPAYKARMLKNAKAAAGELGIDASGVTEIKAVENTDSVHNMIVCTLCSCYPRPILGRPPDWYKSFNYRSRAVVEPRAVMAEFGLELGDNVEVRVHDSTADMRYIVLPRRPPGTEGWSEEQLAALVTRDSMIGVNNPRLDLVAAPAGA